ncbi:MAG: chromosomal replication initiator protein DnaA, partial [Rhodospirillales bacterium]|nr:chromosomal replication initiator protein DnaA [Rhodospirillales bacterium]
MKSDDTAPGCKTPPENKLSEQWNAVSGLLRAEIGEAAYQSWIKPMTVREMLDGQVKMSVPTRFMRDWIVAHYVDRLSKLWGDENPEAKSLEVFIQSDRETAPPVPEPRSGARSGPGSHEDSQTSASGAVEPDRRDNYRVEISAPLDRRFTFDQFVVGKPNEFAYAAARRIAEASKVQFNPLFLYGGVGLGKTHLMHAIAWHIRERTPERTVIYLSAEKFMYRFIRALREQNTVDFKEQFRSVDILMIDDVQFISGKESTQEEFFHTFNALVDQGRQIVISADKSPSDLEGMEERLISRLNCGLVADIHATTYELRLGILQSKAEQLSVKIPEKVLEFLAPKLTAIVRELEDGLNR